VGGGLTSKKYITAASDFTDSNYIKDNIGIQTTYLNAWLLHAAIGEESSVYKGDPNGIRDALKNNKVVVTGGIIPGISTDTVTMLLAESANATHVINVSTPKGVYDETGNFVESMGIDKLIDMALKGDTRVARSSFIFDVIACKIAKRSKTELHFLDKDISNIEGAILKRKHGGTVIK
jgi:uridylate kinase